MRLQKRAWRTGSFNIFVSLGHSLLPLVWQWCSSLACLLKRCWLLNTNGLFLFTSHKPDLGILSMRVTELPDVLLARTIKDLICLNKNYGSKVLHHLAQDSHALPVLLLCSLWLSPAPGKESHKPRWVPGAPLPLPSVFTPGVTLDAWNIAYVFGFCVYDLWPL